MSKVITANELKTKGISAIKAAMGEEELIITERGKNKYIVMPIEHYNYLRECELEAALIESKKEYAEKKYIKESVSNHIKRITGA
ncbi:MAG: type II toxin-antitoxin system prevent-host-death family antitoxin [Spirochaetia bacterium]|nr:type II toxin-antitoxin system prevent-host-death family antitoxin [Spirochaetia bacterium]